MADWLYLNSATSWLPEGASCLSNELPQEEALLRGLPPSSAPLSLFPDRVGAGVDFWWGNGWRVEGVWGFWVLGWVDISPPCWLPSHVACEWADKIVCVWVKTAKACVLRFVCACILSVCGYLVCVLGSLSSENSVCGGGCSDSCRGGAGGADCSLPDKGGFTLETWRED